MRVPSRSKRRGKRQRHRQCAFDVSATADASASAEADGDDASAEAESNASAAATPAAPNGASMSRRQPTDPPARRSMAMMRVPSRVVGIGRFGAEFTAMLPPIL
jgi:hypothetical protein